MENEIDRVTSEDPCADPTFVRRLKDRVSLHRDPETGIAWVTDATGIIHGAHPSISDEGSVDGMIDRGVWPSTALPVLVAGIIYDVSQCNAAPDVHEYESLADAECLCSGVHLRNLPRRAILPTPSLAAARARDAEQEAREQERAALEQAVWQRIPLLYQTEQRGKRGIVMADPPVLILLEYMSDQVLHMIAAMPFLPCQRIGQYVSDASDGKEDSQ